MPVPLHDQPHHQAGNLTFVVCILVALALLGLWQFLLHAA